MKKLYVIAFILIIYSVTIHAQQWTKLGDDDNGDAIVKHEPDVKALSYYYDENTDTLVFLVQMNTRVSADTIGINIALNVEGAGVTTSWIGPQNDNFQLNRLVTFWYELTSSGPMGVIGIADGNGVKNDDLENLKSQNLLILYNTSLKYYILLVKRSDIFPGNSFKSKVIASVGIPRFPNDDIPNDGSFQLNLLSMNTSINEFSPTTFSAYPNPSKGSFVLRLPEASMEHFTVKVYDLYGHLILSKPVNQSTTDAAVKVDLSSEEPGVYSVILSSPKGNYSTQIFKR